MKDCGIIYIGRIPNNWKTTRIKYITTVPVTTGAGEEALDYEEGRIRYIRISDFNKSGDILEDKKAYIPYDKGCKYLLEPGDILAATAGGTVGKTLLFCGLDEPACYAGYLARIKTNPIVVNSRYLLYQMQCPIMDGFRNISVKKSTIENISASTYSNMPIVVPPINDQLAIVDFLNRQCDQINMIVERTQASIEEYKILKQAIITQAVTKGILGDRLMKDSGENWIGEIPIEWNVFRICSLYEERRESGNENLPILTVSINTGVSDRELSDNENERIFIRSEDKTKYSRVYPGDLTYNMMRAWQGAFGAVRVEGMVSPAYVIAKPKTEIDSRYMEALLRTPSAMQEMKRYSYGIADFRMRLYWSYFKNIKVCIPPLSEQIEIADFIDVKSKEIDTLIEKKEELLVELNNYKNSMIFECVTGKKEV